jgi:alpha-beta hydrolase superfamily lysophospholipase
MSRWVHAMIDFMAFCPMTNPTDYPTSVAFHSHFKLPWKDVKGNEMETFVGIIGHIGKKIPILFYSYANCEHSHSKTLIDFLHQVHLASGFVIVVWDYPGYGPFAQQSSEQVDDTILHYIQRKWQHVPVTIPLPSGQGMYCAGEKVLTYLREKYPNNPLYLWGRSIGTTVTVHLMCANQAILEKVILESPLCSALRWQTGWIWLQAPCDEFTSLDEIKSTKLQGKPWKPVYIIYPEKDEVIQPSHIRAFLTELGTNNAHLEVIPGAGHNTVYFEHVGKVINWLTTKKSPIK